ncbi:hypothetical protein F5J12DRAFT_889643 [Pisolithus orientalis]|uniref:uncharacterized protein n=1 Tax=Pisolithus orientalis TaxID=936130 RepID=UPI0022245924|nr:uncharacterized protein F5J12DRAFT_889643 [Pisolithus orientalis]KAI6025752.1 hypothetical protein F5J12DRAFT_889643 [Pisolithus orientalis]
MAAAAVSLSCPPRRSLPGSHMLTRLTIIRRPLRFAKRHRPRIPAPVADSEPDPDSSSSDPENELTPRALRALKRQRLALDLDSLSISPRGRPRKRRKENFAHANSVAAASSRKETPQTGKSHAFLFATFGNGYARIPSCENAAHIPSIPECPVNFVNGTASSVPISSNDGEPSSTSYLGPAPCDSFADQSSILMLTDDSNSSPSVDNKATDVSAPSVPPISTDATIAPLPLSPPLVPCAPSSPESEPLTPLTPLTPSPSPSPSGHDRHTSSGPPSPLTEPLPLLVSIEPVSLPSDSLSPSTPHPPPLSAEGCTSAQPAVLSPHPSHLSLDPPLDNLISFDGLPPNFDSGMSLHLDAHHCNPHEDSHPHPHVPQLPYVRPPFTQIPGRDREVNIWKLACQERVEYLARRFGFETIKAVVASEASSVVNAISHVSPSTTTTSSPEFPTQEDSAHATQPPQTRFRLYTPASYTWSSRSVLGVGSVPGKRSSNDSPQEAEAEIEREALWAESDVDVDVDMDIDADMDDDDDDYEDEDELGELEGDADGENRVDLDMEGTNGKSGAAMQQLLGENLKVMDAKGEDTMMDVDCMGQSQRGPVDLADKENHASASAAHSSSLFTTSDESQMTVSAGLATMPSPSTSLALPLRHQFPPLSSLHVPLLSEPPRAFMGRGTPPDRRRLMEWSISDRYPGCQTQAIGVGLFVSPTRNPGINTVPMSMVSMHHPAADDVHQGGGDDRSQPHHHAGEWTSFLYAMLEGDGINNCQVDTNVPSTVCRTSNNTPGNMSVGAVATTTGSTTDVTGWYELGLASMHMGGSVTPGVPADMSLSHHPHVVHVSPIEHPGDEASSSTLRFALG